MPLRWNVNATGTPEKVAQGLQNQLDSMPEGLAKAFFAQAVPNLMALVRQNQSPPKHPHFICIKADGEAWVEDANIVRRNCHVSITTVHVDPHLV